MRIAIIGNGFSKFCIDWYRIVEEEISEIYQVAAQQQSNPGVSHKVNVARSVDSHLVQKLETIRAASNKIGWKTKCFPYETKAVALLAREGYYDIIITTNYDTFIERALNKICRHTSRSWVRNPCLPANTNTNKYCGHILHAGKLNPSDLLFWKIHGDINLGFWTCCGMIEKINQNMSFPYENHLHMDCQGYQLGQYLHYVLLPELLKYDSYFIHVINSCIANIQNTISANKCEIDIMGYRGKRDEIFCSSLIEALRTANKKLEINYINKELNSRLNYALKMMEGQHNIQRIKGDIWQVWLEDLINKCKLMPDFRGYVS